MKHEHQGWKLCRCMASGEAAIAAGSRCRVREDSRFDHDASARREARPGGVGHEPASGAVWPDGRTSQEKFANLRAELWWKAREALGRSRELLRHLRGEPEGVAHPLEAVLLLPEDEALARQLASPRWFRTEAGKVLIEDKERLAAALRRAGLVVVRAGHARAHDQAGGRSRDGVVSVIAFMDRVGDGGDDADDASPRAPILWAGASACEPEPGTVL